MNEPDAVKVEPVAREPLFRAPKVVLILIAFLVVLHVAIQLGGESWQVWSLYAFSFIPARISGDAPFPAIWGSQVWSFVTLRVSPCRHDAFVFQQPLASGFWFRGGAQAWNFQVSGAGMRLHHHGCGCNASHPLGQAAIMIGASGAVSGVMAAAIPLMYGDGLAAWRYLPHGHRHGEALAAFGNPHKQAGVYLYF